MNVPVDLPLPGGRVACITCHRHESAADHGEARLHHTKLLRRPEDGASLCVLCHDQVSELRRDLHATMLQKAHLTWPNQPRLESPQAAEQPPRSLDPQTQTCLSCHDGSVASDTLYTEAGGPVPAARSFVLGEGHPLGSAYGARKPRTSDSVLRPVQSLDARIRLFGSRIGCGTCHSPYSRRRALLVVPNDHSRLCLSCHDL